jgi:hypothetical protein
LSTTVWGFKSGDVIDTREYPQVKGLKSVRRWTCPHGTHVFDISLPSWSPRLHASDARKCPKPHGPTAREDKRGRGSGH